MRKQHGAAFWAMVVGGMKLSPAVAGSCLSMLSFGAAWGALSGGGVGNDEVPPLMVPIPAPELVQAHGHQTHHCIWAQSGYRLLAARLKSWANVAHVLLARVLYRRRISGSHRYLPCFLALQEISLYGNAILCFNDYVFPNLMEFDA